ncbi:MAG TPA: DoxX family protein [Herpetosiphonaceae bacterium]
MWRRSNTSTRDLGLLALRLTAGGLMAGHGAQKLFGAFGGYGLEGTGGWLESIGLKPGKNWAMMAGGAEFGSGMLTALGFLHPLGPISMFGPMIMAWTTVHTGKPIWATSGGAELPLMYLATASALGLTGPGSYSLDEAFGVEVPTSLVLLTAAGVAAGIGAGIMMQEPPPQEQADEAGGELQAGTEAGGEGIDTALAAGE